MDLTGQLIALTRSSLVGPSHWTILNIMDHDGSQVTVATGVLRLS